MTAHLLIAVASAFAAGLTLFSGFGLGTLLLPVFALFFPPALAVGATAVVHGANNLFKLLLVGRKADRSLVVRFGVPAIAAAVVGAALLAVLGELAEVGRYRIAGREAVVTPLGLVLGVLMIVFSLFELVPRLRELRVERQHLVVGGLLSGFFGGLSGHQGALRSTFLTKVGISTEAFVGTNAAIGFLVDALRIAVYAVTVGVAHGASPFAPEDWRLVATAVVAAFVGVVLARKYVRKVEMTAIRVLTGVLLLAIGALLAAGWI